MHDIALFEIHNVIDTFNRKRYRFEPPSQTNEKKIKPSQTSPISIKSVNHNVDLEQCDVMHKQGGRNVVGP